MTLGLYKIKEFHTNGTVTTTYNVDKEPDERASTTRKIAHKDIPCLERRLETGRILFREEEGVELCLPASQFHRDQLQRYLHRTFPEMYEGNK